MLTAYINAAMQKAHCEILPDNFVGPYSGGKHQFMVKGKLRVRIPNPHKGDSGENLLKQILKEL